MVIQKSFILAEIKDLGGNLKNDIRVYGLFKITDLEEIIEKITHGLAKITDLGEKFEKKYIRIRD